MAEALRELRTISKLTEEGRRRPLRRRTIEIIEYQPADPDRPETHLALEGTVTLIVARHGNRFHAKIREAVDKNDPKAGELAKKMYRQYKGRKRVALAKAVESALAEPILADVLHGETRLVESLFVPRGLDVAFIALPYNGGRFAKGGLVVLEHPRTEKAESLEIIALAHAPKLSRAELGALKDVPELQAANNIGDPGGPISCGTGLLAAAVAAEVVVLVITFAITGKVDIEHIEHLSESQINRLGPAATARALVQLRRDALGGKTITTGAPG